MTPRVCFAVIVVVALVVAGCRQPDGEVPAPNATVQEELVDVSRDLQYIASGSDPGAAGDLAADLRKYTSRTTAVPAVDELSARAAAAVGGSKLTQQTADQLAQKLWLSVAARDMSERQVEGLQNETQSLLVSMGIPEERAAPVAAQVGEVQRAVTDRPRRWYELF